ncbi:Acyl dehydratase [Kytococcus aerolatus]|uniref:Acyl dehydratase n=1 Tax=Kytococcus aerolatus TaxID=592308 RepID=A0A212TA78_9MICO|nr:MaoC/PaaZ C-terminal domain-containing protein [Kytococcus aerolatus]SNC62932.1 Acyl dehydratase [Kytococcus aerolatus]
MTRATPPAVPEVGDELFSTECHLGRAELIAYAAASGDHNPIHWSDRIAAEVGLPGVLAHGMLTMGQAASAVTDWAGDPARVVEIGARFAAPVVVPDPEGVRLVVSGSAKAVEGGRVTVALTVTTPGAGPKPVLGRATAVVDLEETTR